MDGCAKTGTPDRDDWLRTCAVRAQIKHFNGLLDDINRLSSLGIDFLPRTRICDSICWFIHLKSHCQVFFSSSFRPATTNACAAYYRRPV